MNAIILLSNLYNAILRFSTWLTNYREYELYYIILTGVTVIAKVKLSVCKKTRCHFNIVGHLLYEMFVLARTTPTGWKVNKNLNISHIYVCALENIP